MASTNVVFHSYSPTEASDPCSICFDPLEQEAVAHGEENWHPACKKCMLEWIKYKSACPLCRKEADFSSILPLKERFVSWISSSVFSGRGLRAVVSGLGAGTIASLWSARAFGISPFSFELTRFAGAVFGAGSGYFLSRRARIPALDALCYSVGGAFSYYMANAILEMQEPEIYFGMYQQLDALFSDAF